MGSGLSRNRAGCPFSWRLSANIWLFWVVCSCGRTRKSMRGVRVARSLLVGGMDVMETEEGRAVEDKGMERRRGQGRKGGVQRLDLRTPAPTPPPPRATPLTTTWLQCTADSFIHTASKISSGPKLHSRAAPWEKQGCRGDTDQHPLPSNSIRTSWAAAQGSGLSPSIRPLPSRMSLLAFKSSVERREARGTRPPRTRPWALRATETLTDTPPPPRLQWPKPTAVHSAHKNPVL